MSARAFAGRGITRPMTEQDLIEQARRAARAFRERHTPLTWTEAIDTAPWPKSAPPAFEAPFRTAFTQVLVDRGLAKKRAITKQKRKPGTSGTPTSLMRRLLNATPAEFEAQDAVAKRKELKWSTWARRVLAEAVAAEK
jgi:hypothetical protein